MRENIGLYRGKTTVTEDSDEWQEWVEGYYSHFVDTEKGRETHRIYLAESETDCGDYFPDWFEIDPETLGEYSGVDDKHGIKLFEGDLVEARLCEGNWQGFSWGVQKVVFKNGAFGLLNSKEDFTPFANFADRVEFIKKGTVFD